MDDLKALARLINDSVSKIEEVCTAQHVPLPSLKDSFPLGEDIRFNPVVASAVNDIVAATDHIGAIVRSAPSTLLVKAVGFHVSSALRLAIETNVTEILREAGEKGLHVDEIANKAHVDSNKLARVLRMLASHHIFKELTPDIFANNRISSALDSGKPSEDNFQHPERKHLGTSGISSFLATTLHHVFKASSVMTDTLVDPASALSHDATKAPFCRAFNTELDFFPWLEQPGNEALLTEFGIAMEGSRAFNPNLVVDGFDWNSLPDGSKVVDVGGGVGAQSLLIAKANPRLKLIVQDREDTIQEAISFWEQKNPTAITSGQVTFQASDFFAEQQVKDAEVFLLRAVLHDWSDSYCNTILLGLRESATPSTKLVVLDILVLYACEDNSSASRVPGATISPPPPPPLLPNHGVAQFSNFMDLQMLVLFNGQERTLAHMQRLFEKAGWSVDSVFRSATSSVCVVVAKPI